MNSEFTLLWVQPHSHFRELRALATFSGWSGSKIILFSCSGWMLFDRLIGTRSNDTRPNPTPLTRAPLLTIVYAEAANDI